jgi:hypothetical protein
MGGKMSGSMGVCRSEGQTHNFWFVVIHPELPGIIPGTAVCDNSDFPVEESVRRV